MVKKLEEQEKMLKQKFVLLEANGYLSPKINIQQKLANGYISAEDFTKQHKV